MGSVALPPQHGSSVRGERAVPRQERMESKHCWHWRMRVCRNIVFRDLVNQWLQRGGLQWESRSIVHHAAHFWGTLYPDR